MAELGADGLKITDLFRFPTVRALAEHLSAEGAEPSLQRSRDRADARRGAMARRRAARGRRRRRGGDEQASE